MDGVRECQLPGVQTVWLYYFCGGAITPVTDDRMPEFGDMQPNLMSPARMWDGFDDTGTIHKTLDDVECGTHLFDGIAIG